MKNKIALAKHSLIFLLLLTLMACDEDQTQQPSTRVADLIGLQVASMPIDGKVCRIMPSSVTTTESYETRLSQVSDCTLQGEGAAFTDTHYGTPQIEFFGPGTPGSVADVDKIDNYLSLCRNERENYLRIVAPNGQLACWNSAYKDVVDLIVSQPDPNSPTRDCANLYALGASYRHANDWACLDGKTSTFERAYDPIDFKFSMNGCAEGQQRVPADISGVGAGVRAATDAEKDAILKSQRSNTCGRYDVPNPNEVLMLVPDWLGQIGYSYYANNSTILNSTVWENGSFSNSKFITFRLRNRVNNDADHRACIAGYIEFMGYVRPTMQVKVDNPTQNSAFCYQGPSGFSVELVSTNLGLTQPDKECLELQAGRYYLCHAKYAIHSQESHVITRVQLSKAALSNQSMCTQLAGNGIPSQLVQNVCLTETLLDYGLDYQNWAAGQPNNGGVADTAQDVEDCAFTNNSGLWGDDACVKSKRFVCRHKTDVTRWLVTTATGPWVAGGDECLNAGSQLGEYVFAKPQSEYENFQLRKVLPAEDVWINYAQKSDRQWISPDYSFVFKHFVNVAQAKVHVEQSSTSSEGNREAFRAIDGNRDGLASSNSISLTQTELNPWWEVDLEDDVEVAYISVWNRQDSCCTAALRNATVTLLDSGHNVIETKTIVAPERENVLRFTGRKNVRFVRVAGATGSNMALSLAEVDVWTESEMSHCSDDLKTECQFPQLHDVLNDLNKQLGSYVDLTPTVEQLTAIGDHIDVIDIASVNLDPSAFELKLDLRIAGETVEAFIYQIRDEYNLPHVMLSFALPSSKLNWQSLFGSLKNASMLTGVNFPRALVTIPLSGDNGSLYPPITLNRSALPNQVLALYESVYGAEAFEQRIYTGVNIAGGIPVNQIVSESTRNNLGIEWGAATQVVLAGSLGISLTDLSVGNWYAAEELFLKSQFPIPNNQSITLLNNAKVKNLYGSIYVASGELELGLATRVETIINNQALEFEAFTHQALGRQRDFVLKGSLSAWNNGLGLESGVFKQMGMLYWSNDINQQFSLSGKLKVNNTLSLENVVTLNRDRVQGEKNLELLLSAANVTDDDLEALLTDLTGTSYGQVLPDRIEDIKNLEISFGVGNTHWLSVKGKSTVCLQKVDDANLLSNCKTPVDIAFELQNNNGRLAFNAALDLQPGQQFTLDPVQSVVVTNLGLASECNTSECRLKLTGQAVVPAIANTSNNIFNVELSLENNTNAYTELTIQTQSSYTYTLAQLISAVQGLGYFMPSTDWLATLKGANPATIRFTNMTVAVRKGSKTNLHLSAETALNSNKLEVHLEATPSSGYIGFNFADNALALSDVVEVSSLPASERADDRQVDFDELTFLFSSGNLAYADLTYVGKQYIDQHFASQANQAALSTGLNFLAMVGTHSNFSRHLSVFGHNKPLFITGLLNTSPNFSLNLQAGMGEVLNCALDSNKNKPACAEAPPVCDASANLLCNMPAWLSSSNLQFNLAVDATHFDVGFSGNMDVLPSPQAGISTLVVNGDLNVYTNDSTLGFCAELRDDAALGSGIEKIQLREGDDAATINAKTARCLQANNGAGTGTGFELFGIDGVRFNNVGLYLGLKPTQGAMAFKVGAKIKFEDTSVANGDPEVINIDSFGGAFNPFGPTAINLAVSSTRSFNSNDVFKIYNVLTDTNKFENTDKLPQLEFYPVKFNASDTTDLIKLNIEADVQSLTNLAFQTGVRIRMANTEPQTLGILMARMSSQSFEFSGIVELMGLSQQASIVVNKEYLEMATRTRVPVSGSFTNFARCGANGAYANAQCGIQTVYSRACDFASSGSKLLTYYFNAMPNYANALVCSGNTDCSSLYASAQSACDAGARETVSATLDTNLLLHIDWAGGINGEGIAFYRTPSYCYEIGGHVSYNGQFTMNATTSYSSTKCQSASTSTMLMAAADVGLPYPLNITEPSKQVSNFDFNGDGAGDVLYTLDVPNAGAGNNTNDWYLSYSGRSEPVLLRSGEEFVAQFVYGDVDGDGASDIVVAKRENDTYVWQATTSELSQTNTNEAKWRNILPESIRYVGEQDAGPQIEVTHTGGKTITTLLEFNFGNFKGDSRHEALLITRGTDAALQLYVCELPSITCEHAVTTGLGSDASALHIGQFDNDAYHELFLTQGENWYLIQPQDAGPWSRSLYRANTMEDIKADSDLVGQGYDVTHYTENIAKSLRFGDFNGDGRTDIFTARTQNEMGQWKWAVSSAGGDWEYINAAWEHPSQLRVSDLNGDGVADVFTITESTHDGLVDWSISHQGRNRWITLNASEELPLSVLSLGETRSR